MNLQATVPCTAEPSHVQRVPRSLIGTAVASARDHLRRYEGNVSMLDGADGVGVGPHRYIEACGVFVADVELLTDQLDTASTQLSELRDAWRVLQAAEATIERLGKYSRMTNGMSSDLARAYRDKATARGTLMRVLGGA